MKLWTCNLNWDQPFLVITNIFTCNIKQSFNWESHWPQIPRRFTDFLHYSSLKDFKIFYITPFMHNNEKWLSTLQKFCAVKTTNLFMYPSSFFIIMHEIVKSSEHLTNVFSMHLFSTSWNKGCREKGHWERMD